MDTPQEVEVWFIMPALRKHFVNGFKKNNVKQKDIANRMNLTQAAVSQYTKNKRGNNVSFDEKIVRKINDSCKYIITQNDFRMRFQKILKEIKKSKTMCNVCHDHIDTDIKCNICYA
jgi:predicted transcriptional regulator